jgi:hypothetical protein
MRRVVFGMVVLLCAALAGCGGKSGDGGGTVIPPPPTPTFKCSDSPAAVDQVVLRCGVKLSPDVWQIDVMIGAHTATDIGGFAFDLLFDPTVLAYVPSSAQSGSLLFQNGDTPLISVKTDPGDPGRLIVGISLTGGAAAVGVVPGTYDRIMVFSVKVVPGAQFDPDPKHLVFDMEKSQALDSSDPPQPILSITFRDQLLLSYQ